jgi:hypothetical protein
MNIKIKCKIMEYGTTAHNRSVYAAPAVAGLVFRSLGHFALLHSHAHSRHIWAARNPTGFFIVPPKRHIQPERYTTWGPKRVYKILYIKAYRQKHGVMLLWES